MYVGGCSTNDRAGICLDLASSISSQSSAASAILATHANFAGLGGFSGRESSVSASWLAAQVKAGATTADDILKLSQVYGRAAVALNLNGDRFADESAGTSETILNYQLARQPKGQGFYIIDGDAIGQHALIGGVAEGETR